MTVLVAVKKLNKVFLGADSLTTLGDRKLSHTINDSKIIKFNNFAVGISGTGPIRDVFEEMSLTEWTNYDIKDRASVHIFIDEFFIRFKDNFPDMDSEDKTEFLVCTKNKIFLVSDEVNIFEKKDFWAAGCGDSYALGALEVLYPEMTTKTKIKDGINQAIKTACKFSMYCETPIEVIEV